MHGLGEGLVERSEQDQDLGVGAANSCSLIP